MSSFLISWVPCIDGLHVHHVGWCQTGRPILINLCSCWAYLQEKSSKKLLCKKIGDGHCRRLGNKAGPPHCPLEDNKRNQTKPNLFHPLHFLFLLYVYIYFSSTLYIIFIFYTKRRTRDNQFNYKKFCVYIYISSLITGRQLRRWTYS